MRGCPQLAASDARLRVRSGAGDQRPACPETVTQQTAGQGPESLDSEMHHNQHLQMGNQNASITPEEVIHNQLKVF